MTLNFFEGAGRGWSLAGRPFSFELNILGERVYYSQSLPSDFLLLGASYNVYL